MVTRFAERATELAERWLPDAFVFALIGTVVVFVAALVHGAAPGAIVDAWGAGLWDLLPFTLQMSLVIVTGSVVATARPVRRLIDRLATIPTSARGAVAFVAFFAMASSWLNWGFSLIFSAMLARAIARRVPVADYRALAASSFLGLGSVWAQGLSGSAALQMATPSSLTPALRQIVVGDGSEAALAGGTIGLAHTIFLWQSFASVAIELVVVTSVAWAIAPPADRAKSAAALGIALADPGDDEPPAAGPGEWLERSPLLALAFSGLAVVWLGRYLRHAEGGIAAVNLNVVNLAFLAIGFLLHGTPARLMRATREATPAIWGVVLQFPLYAGIAAILTKCGLSEVIARVFVEGSTRTTFPALVAAYSALLGVFVPSGGSKWVIEAPYVLAAAHRLHVHLGWTVCVYDLGEALGNLVQPFWMLPILGVFGLRARDVMGFTFVVFLVLAPLVLALVTLLGVTLSYPL